MLGRSLRKLFNAEAPPPMIWEPQVQKPVRTEKPYYFTHIRRGIHALPPELLALFKESDKSLYVLKRGTEMYPLFTDETQKGVEELSPAEKKELDKYLSDPEGVYIREQSLVACFYGNSNRLPFSSNKVMEPGFTVVHEVGHLFDDIISENAEFYSNSDEFKQAFYGDFRLLPPKDKAKAININASAQRVNDPHFFLELFADVFAETILDRAKLALLLPSVQNLVEQKIKQVCEQYRKNNPDFDPETYPKMDIAAA